MQGSGAFAVGDASARGVADVHRPLRRGLPRVPGGEPWPPVLHLPVATAQVAEPSVAEPVEPSLLTPAPQDRATSVRPLQKEVERVQESGAFAVGDASARGVADAHRPLRRGLPRVPGGEPWPPVGVARVPTPVAEPVEASSSAPQQAQEPLAPPLRHGQEPTSALRTEVPAPQRIAEPVDLGIPLPFPQTVFPGAAAQEWNAERRGEASIPARPDAQRYGPFTRLQWAGAAIIGGLGLLVAAAFTVLAVRWVLSLEVMRDFVATYPGEYPLPEAAPVGFPAWLAWQHFFNVFLIVLIIRTGLTVHNEKRPSAFWSPRTNKKRKISLTLWLHQSLDILWLVNGVAYVVLLFATAQWMRIVPTSWEVFPNALSAALQYVSLNWPTENGWVNYNSLQQLAYFTTVFIAAPLAAITGVRMSGVWPKNADALNSMYPVEWARRLHYPVMVYFVAFIAVHVALVLATNALRNLNHMYGGQDAVNWTGFWIFVASMVVVAAGWVAARPLVLAPIARLFGTVSAR